jgi:hypothetical protein
MKPWPDKSPAPAAVGAFRSVVAVPSRFGSGSAFYARRPCARIENIKVTTKTINDGVCSQLVKLAAMKTTPHIARLIATLALLLPVLTSCAADSPVAPAMVGHWEGNARIIVSWCHQKNLSVKLNIQADGSVSGTVGDAKLTDGRFKSNRGWLLRKLNWSCDYIITGGLEGDIVAAEGIKRQRVMIALDYQDGTFKAGADTEGSLCVFSSEQTRKEKMALTARPLKLIRSQ